LQREELWCDLLAAREHAFQRTQGRSVTADPETQANAVAQALVESWKRFQSTEASADEFVTRLHCAWPPGKGARPSRSLRRAGRKRVPLCIEDPERRVAAQLAWLRMYPKVRTPCCSSAVCFKCKVRGWHPHVTCEERQRQETGRDAQYCPNCQVPTTRSDGCTQIRCVCGTEWTWQERDDAGPIGHVDDEDFDDESERSSEVGMNSCELLRSRTALELACMNPALRNSKVIELLISAPELKNLKERSRDEVTPSTGRVSGVRTCALGHRLSPWDSTRTPDGSGGWVCDGCQVEDKRYQSRYRCDACDFDLCREAEGFSGSCMARPMTGFLFTWG